MQFHTPLIHLPVITFVASLFQGENLSSGKVVIRVTYFGVQVHTETHDICEEISCPIAAGKFVLSHTQSLPVFTPPVSFIRLCALIFLSIAFFHCDYVKDSLKIVSVAVLNSTICSFKDLCCGFSGLRADYYFKSMLR